MQKPRSLRQLADLRTGFFIYKQNTPLREYFLWLTDMNLVHLSYHMWMN